MLKLIKAHHSQPRRGWLRVRAAVQCAPTALNYNLPRQTNSSLRTHCLTEASHGDWSGAKGQEGHCVKPLAKSNSLIYGVASHKDVCECRVVTVHRERGEGEQCAGTVRSAKKCATFAKVKSICRFIRLSVPDHKNSSFTLPSPFTHSKFLSLVSFHFIWLWVCDLVLVPKPPPPPSLSLSLHPN